jgi:hypothetical protein
MVSLLTSARAHRLGRTGARAVAAAQEVRQKLMNFIVS